MPLTPPPLVPPPSAVATEMGRQAPAPAKAWVPPILPMPLPLLPLLVLVLVLVLLLLLLLLLLRLPACWVSP